MLFEYDWGEAAEEERNQICLFEIELDAQTIEKRAETISSEIVSALDF